LDGGGKISGGFVVACRDSPKLLELAEEICDQPAGLVEVFVVRPRLFAIGL
jgi:hypothetical protein